MDHDGGQRGGQTQFLVPNLPLLGEIPASSGLTLAQRLGPRRVVGRPKPNATSRGELAPEKPGRPDSCRRHPGIVSTGSGESGKLWVHECDRLRDQLVVEWYGLPVLGRGTSHDCDQCDHRRSGRPIRARAIDAFGLRHVGRGRCRHGQGPGTNRRCLRNKWPKWDWSFQPAWLLDLSQLVFIRRSVLQTPVERDRRQYTENLTRRLDRILHGVH